MFFFVFNLVKSRNTCWASCFIFGRGSEYPQWAMWSLPYSSYSSCLISKDKWDHTVCYSMVGGYSIVLCGLLDVKRQIVWYGNVQYDMVQRVIVWYAIVQYDIVQYQKTNCTVWYGTVWCGLSDMKWQMVSSWFVICTPARVISISSDGQKNYFREPILIPCLPKSLLFLRNLPWDSPVLSKAGQCLGISSIFLQSEREQQCYVFIHQ